LFLKENRVELVSMFSSEAAGLRALGSAGNGAAPVPEALAWGTEGSRSFLLMEAVETGQLFSGEEFGKSLAVMHKQARSSSCGFSADNRIGSSIQHNTPMESWHDFFAEKRLGVQWKMAREKGYGDAVSDKAVESLLKGLKNILPEPDEGWPSLLHGDLWGGNWLPGADGRGWLIDPAVYYGHREADIAMTELFGGFPSGFYSGYRNFWPLEPGYSERRDLYNLYHLLNHLNLFGQSWWSGVIGTIRKYS
jgi:fructosamine-3-kinase